MFPPSNHEHDHQTFSCWHLSYHSHLQGYTHCNLLSQKWGKVMMSLSINTATGLLRLFVCKQSSTRQSPYKQPRAGVRMTRRHGRRVCLFYKALTERPVQVLTKNCDIRAWSRCHTASGVLDTTLLLMYWTPHCFRCTGHHTASDALDTILLLMYRHHTASDDCTSQVELWHQQGHDTTLLLMYCTLKMTVVQAGWLSVEHSEWQWQNIWSTNKKRKRAQQELREDRD